MEEKINRLLENYNLRENNLGVAEPALEFNPAVEGAGLDPRQQSVAGLAIFQDTRATYLGVNRQGASRRRH